MLVTEKLNIGAKTEYTFGNTAGANEKPAQEVKGNDKEAELILSDSAKQSKAKQSGEADEIDIWDEKYNYTPQEAQEMISAANERILSNASESVLAQANQDANRVAELLSA